MKSTCAFRPIAALAFAGVLSFAPAAHAGERTTISSLPIMPAPRDASDPKVVGVPGLRAKTPAATYAAPTELSVATSQGYCLVSREYNLQLSSSSIRSPTSVMDEELWRFTEADGTASLERTRFDLVERSDPAAEKKEGSIEKVPAAKSKTSIALSRVAQSNGITVWGFRESNGNVVLLAKAADSGRETPLLNRDKDADGLLPMSSSSCNFGAVRISAQTLRSGGVVQLRGSLSEGEGKDKVFRRFVIDGSVAKVARDPEPVLAVRVRILG